MKSCHRQATYIHRSCSKRINDNKAHSHLYLFLFLSRLVNSSHITTPEVSLQPPWHGAAESAISSHMKRKAFNPIPRKYIIRICMHAHVRRNRRKDSRLGLFGIFPYILPDLPWPVNGYKIERYRWQQDGSLYTRCCAPSLAGGGVGKRLYWILGNWKLGSLSVMYRGGSLVERYICWIIYCVEVPGLGDMGLWNIEGWMDGSLESIVLWLSPNTLFVFLPSSVVWICLTSCSCYLWLLS